MIIAIGGGEVRNNETYEIDKFIVEKSGKKSPRLLFIPTASGDSIPYVETITSLYGGLGCQLDTLLLCDDNMTVGLAKEKIGKADIIYVGGGDTEFMIKKWYEFEVDKFLLEAYEKGKILSGLSAGSICWFIGGYDFEDGDEKEGPDYIKVDGLGFIPYMNCPHYDQVKPEYFDEFYKKELVDGEEKQDLIGAENQTAIVWDQGEIYVIKSDSKQNVYCLSGDSSNFKKTILG